MPRIALRSRLSLRLFLALSIVIVTLSSNPLQAQVSRDTCIEVTATAATSSPYITLRWPAISSATGTIHIYRRMKGATSWGTVTDIASTSTTYADATALPGVAYEYSLQCSRSTAPTTVYGGIVSGSNIPLVESRGNVILLVDNTLATALAPEITQLEKNLVADGWKVFRHDVARQSIAATSTTSTDFAPRLAELQAVRAIVQNDYNSNGGGTNWSLLILGHIPVPYSGSTAPDGHSDHYGAWPTDTYYADINGTWTDSSINTGTSSSGLIDARNYNLPGDGKFDASTTPSPVELQCGRVDLANMPNVPTGLTEVQRLRQYLVRDHLFRRNQAPYNTVTKKMLMADNFWYFGGEAFASSGWRAAFSLIGRNAGTVIEGDWFTNLQTTPMLLAYGCGSGGFTGISGIGSSTTAFNQKDSKSVFNMTFGSYFGDWDSPSDNVLRAPLAGTANSLGLVNVWSGRGYFQFYHLGLGDTVGYCTRFTQNNSDSVYSSGWSTNGYTRYVTYNLMGDPTLRLHSIVPPTQITATSSTGGIVLNWSASPDTTLSGYHVYRATSTTGPFIRITGTVADGVNPTGSCLSTSTLTYADTDSALVEGTAYTYLVKAVRMETSASGTYANQSLGESVTLPHLSANATPLAPTRLIVSRTGTTTNVLTWDDNASNETGYLVERRDPSSGVWNQIAALSANLTTYTDAGATAGQVAHYRVRASSNNGSSDYSNETADYTLPGLAYGNLCTYFVNKATTSASLAVTRFNGSMGNVSLSYTTSDFLSTAGTDYTSTSNTISWSHNESGSKSLSFPVLNATGQNLSRIVKVTYSSPTNGLALNNPTASFVYLYNPAAQILPNGWLTTTFGNIVSGEAGYAEHDNGTFGLAVRSDVSGIWGGTTTDSARFLYQSVSGDCQLTARLKYMTGTIASNMIAGAMIRTGLSGDAITDSLMQYQGYTTPFRATRTTVGGGLSTALIATNVVWFPFKYPVWIRLTRTGKVIAIETSADGISWTAAKSDVTLSGLGTSAYVGLYVASGNIAFPGGPAAYAQYDNVTLYSVPAAVTSLTASTTTATQSGQIVLNWTSSSATTSYLIERSTTSGSGFSQVGTSATTSYVDNNLVPNTTYYYRVKAINPVYQATAYSPQTSSVPYLPATLNGWRYLYFGSESATGNAAPLATPANDGITNLMKYATGLNPLAAYNPSIVSQSRTQLIGQDTYLTCTFVRNTAAADVTYTIEVTNDPTSGWTSIDPLAVANQLSVQVDTPTTGLQTIVVKDSQPITATSKRFMRLRVSGP